jgi:MFS family permease
MQSTTPIDKDSAMTQVTQPSTALKAALLLASTLTVMSGATISPALPAIQSAFADVPSAELLTRLILTTPALFIVLGGPIAGIAIDRFGRKRLLIGSALLYGLAGASGAVLTSLLAILIGRAFLGLAVAGITTTVTTLIADYFQGQVRAKLLGLQGAFTSAGGVVFLLLGGLLADVSWQAPFLVYLLSLALLPLLLLTLYEPVRESSSHTGGHQTLPLGLLGLIYGVALIGQIVFYMIPVQLPYYLAELVGAGGAQSGIAIATTTLFATIASLLYGRVRASFGYVQITAIVFMVMSVGYTVIGLANSYGFVLLGLAITGLSLGCLIPNLNSWITDVASDATRGRAVGGLTTALFLGQFLSPILSQPVVRQLGYGTAYGVAGAFVFGLAALLFATKRSLRRLTDSSSSDT